MAITVQHDINTNTYYGLHADTKPIGDGVGNGSIFYEMDTGDVYMYDIENSLWRKQ